jgi:hypothetical protein
MYYLKGLFCDDAWVEYSSSYVYVPRTASSSERLIVEPIPKPKVSIEHEVPVLKQEIPIHHIKSVSNTFECR